MLMRRARAYSSSCSQVVSSGLSLSISSQFTLLQRKIAKKSRKPPFLKFKVIQDHRCWHF